jgi:hypothetical protein
MFTLIRMLELMTNFKVEDERVWAVAIAVDLAVAVALQVQP